MASTSPNNSETVDRESNHRSEPQTFSTVLEQELHFIRKRRHEESNQPATSPAVKDATEEIEDERKFQKQALEMKVFGVALSGGGIRSATFNLGVLQQLAERQLLQHVDYLSTVSGGGYIGGWLAAWLKREGKDESSVANVEKELVPSRCKNATAERIGVKEGETYDLEPAPIRHLRSYSRYLTPRYGFFSADSWTLIAIYLRNVLLNQLQLLAIAVLAVLVTRGCLWCFATLQPNEAVRTGVAAAVIACACLALAVVTRELCLEHNRISKKRIDAKQLHWLVLLPLAAAAVGVVFLFTAPHDFSMKAMNATIATRLPSWLSALGPRMSINDAKAEIEWPAALACAVVFGLVNATVNLLVGVIFYLPASVHRIKSAGVAADESKTKRFLIQSRRVLQQGGWAIIVAFIAGGAAGTLYYLTLAKIIWPATTAAAIVTLGLPLLLAAFVIGGFAEVGLLGDYLEEGEREWWSRFNAWTMIYATAWLTIFGITLYGPWALNWLAEFSRGYVTQAKITAAVGWIATTLMGVAAGKSSLTKDGNQNRLLETIGMIAPYIFVVGLGILVSSLVTVLSASDAGSVRSDYWTTLYSIDLGRLFWIVLACAVALLYSWFLDINLFSLHAMYTNRLVRCYLGASRARKHWGDHDAREQRRGGAPTNSQPPNRAESPLTGLDPWDDFPLRDLRIGEESGPRIGGNKGAIYWGPFPILNTSLNVVRGEELALQDRKAESFVLTPLYCGSRVTGFRELTAAADANITLGRAVSVSGAAVDPNMGYHSSPPLAALMTVFNVRLGRWIENPAKSKLGATGWTGGSPSTAGWLIRELLGFADDKADYVHLSDGGHFENLGIYELVRRRCKFILALDAGADPLFSFFDLGSAIEKCKVDFGVPIDINLDALRINAVSHRSRWHCAVGPIKYSEVHGGDHKDDGVLIYIKTSLTGDEPSDVLSYAWTHESFPHQSTVDQFFDETQFESYRALGYHVAQKVLGDGAGGDFLQLAASQDTMMALAARKADVHTSPVSDLFGRVGKHWQGMPLAVQDKFAKIAADYVQLHRQMMESPKFADITRNLYPDVFATAPDADANAIAATSWELHLVCQALQLFQAAWVELQPGEYRDSSLNRSLSQIMRRWARSEMIAKYWSAVNADLTDEFKAFFKGLSSDTLDS
jgi:Patatin-like phospholipase